jgi:ribosomal protein S18 acetylase RimI-like enzyme
MNDDIAQAVALRPIEPGDLDFLYRLYASTRQDELAVVDWDEVQKESFLQMQFAAQHAYYMEHFAGASFQVMLLDGEPVGRLYVDRRPDEVRIIDIALLPAYRSRGIGTRYIREILAEGMAAGVPVRIHVEQYNPALRLYHRLGFRPIRDEGVYYLMEWAPKSSYQTEGGT